MADSSARRACADTPQSVAATDSAATIPSTKANFEGLSNQDNFNVFGFRVNPPDPVGDVGPAHYVEMINLVFAVYAKDGTKLLGPVDTGTLWSGFPVEDCTDPSGDPIVLHDQTADRWILSQFTTRGLDDPTLPFYNCVAISTTSDPTGSYYRYAFTTGFNFPDYPKYGVYGDSYINTSREFGPNGEYGIGVYAFERAQMIRGNPNARMVSFFIDGNNPDLLPLVGDGLLPPDMDGPGRPRDLVAPIVGTQDDDYVYGATSDAVNVWELLVKWGGTSATASLVFAAQLPVVPFDSNFPCAPTARDCLPQPGIVNPAQYLDILSDRQRPIWRLAYRKCRVRVAGHEPVGRVEPRHRRHTLVRDPACERRLLDPPAGHGCTDRLHPPLDGLDRPGQAGQHGARIQRRERHRRVSGNPVHGPARDRSRRADATGRGHDRERHRRAADHQLEVG